jgi:hypothetical protein
LAGQSPSQSAHEPGPRNGESGDTSPIHAPTPLDIIEEVADWARPCSFVITGGANRIGREIPIPRSSVISRIRFLFDSPCWTSRLMRPQIGGGEGFLDSIELKRL